MTNNPNRPETFFELWFVGAVRQAGAFHGSRHRTNRDYIEHQRLSYECWCFLNRHYFGLGDGWAGCYPHWETADGKLQSIGQRNG